MKSLHFISGLILIALLSGCAHQKTESVEQKNDLEITSGNIVISGAYALSPLVETWSKGFRQSYPDINIEIKGSGTGQGILDILNKTADLAMVSREINPAEIKDTICKISVARDAVVPVVNFNNPYLNLLLKNGLNTAQLLEIFTSDQQLKWGRYTKLLISNDINVYTRSDNSGAAEVFANFLNCTQTELSGNKLEGDENMIKQIQEDIYGIGFANLNYCFDHESGTMIEGIQILPIDLDFNGRIDWKEQMADSLEQFQRNIWALKFPRNLCRTLSLISVGEPKAEVKMFLKWVLTEGQSYIEETGYTKINTTEVQCSLKKIGL